MPIVFAEDFSVSIEPLKDRIAADELASFYLTITNNLGTPDDYSLEFSDVGLWELYYTEPLSDYQSGINNIQPNDKYTTKVFLKPMKTVPQGSYSSKVLVKSKTSGKKESGELIVQIISSSTPKQYLPNVHCSVILTNNIDPRQTTDLRVVLTNKNTRNIEAAEIEFESDLLKNIPPFVTGLKPLEKKELTFPLTFDPLHQPATDTLKTIIKIDQYTFECNKQLFYIIDYTGEFGVKSEEVSAFMKREEIRTYKNEGNSKKTQRILEPTSFFKGLFSSSIPEPNEILDMDGQRYRAWEVTLAPKETMKIELYTNYRPILHFFIVLIIIGVFYYLLRAPISIKKIAKNVEMREGGVSEVKIMLSIKNRTGNAIEHLTIHDEIPHLTQLHPEFGSGTLKPEKVMKHANGGNVLEWRIDELDPFEERLIVYKIKSNLQILGTFKLPAAIIRYSTKSGRKVKVNSNRLLIGN